jgi:hypothetical protein
MRCTPIKIKGVPKKAMDLFKNLQTSFDTKKWDSKNRKVGITTSALDKKQKGEISRNLELNQVKPNFKAIKMTEKLWGDTQMKAHMDKYGEKPSFGSYKVSGIGDSAYNDNYKKQLRTLAHMTTHFKSALEAM